MVNIREEFKALIPDLSNDEFSQLEENILEYGIQDSIKLWKGDIVDGHNRYIIAQKHNLEYEIEHMDFDDKYQAISYIIVNQLGRRNTQPYDRAVLVLKLKENLEKQYKESKQKAIEESGINEETVREESKFDTRKELATMANVSEGTLMMVNYLDENADDDTIEKVKTGKVAISAAYKKEKRKEKLEEQENQIKEDVKPVEGKFDILVIDPPWPYGREYDPEGSRAANPYPEMEIEEIGAIELPDKDDSILWLWTTHKFLPIAYQLMDAWGYDYKATMVWDKMNMGMGHWLRMQTEFCLLGIKGKPVWNQTNIRDIIREARREHSRKPDSFYEMIEEKFTGSKIDYFSRENRKGWYSYGNEIDLFTQQQ